MKLIASHRGLGSFMVTLLLAGLMGLAFSTPAQAAKDGVNLVIAGTAVSPKEPAPGQRFTIRVTIWNKGQRNAGPFWVEAWRGQSSLRKRAEFKGLKPGARDTQSIALNYPGGISTLAVGPSVVPKQFCVDLVINKLNNKKATVGPSKQVCVSAKTVAKQTTQKPSSKTERTTPKVKIPRARASVPAPTPVAPEAPKGPIEIKIASLDILRDKFALELENKDKERDLRNPRVEVWHVQAGKRNRIYRGYQTILRADSTKLLRISVPKNAKPTDYLELWVNKKLVGKKSLRGVLEVRGEEEPSAPRVAQAKTGLMPRDKALNRVVDRFRLKNILAGMPGSSRRRLVDMPLLTLNADIAGPVDVPREGPATVSWNLSSHDGNGLYLVISERNDPACPDNTAALDALSADVPDRGIKPASGDLGLMLDTYTRGRSYYLWGCALSDGSPNGGMTNMVEMRYGFLVAVTTVEEEVATIPPDLVINNFRMSRGRPTFWVSVNYPRGEGEFRWRVVFVNPSRYAETRGGFDGFEDTGGDDVTVREGTARIRNFGPLGYGARVVLDPLPYSTSTSWVVILQINGIWDRVIIIGPDPRVFYPESNFFNNTAVRLFGVSSYEERYPDMLLNAEVIRKGPGWALIHIRYARWTRSNAWIRLELGDLRAETVAACTSVANSQAYAPTRVGWNQGTTFYCERPESLTGTPAPALLAHAVMRQTSILGPVIDDKWFVVGLNWPERNAEPGLPDLVPEIVSARTGPGGYGGEVTVRITNRGGWASAFAVGHFELRAWGPRGRVRYEDDVWGLGLDPGESLTRTLTIPATVLAVDRTLAYWRVDHTNAVFESNEDNNEVRRSMPAAEAAGTIEIPVSQTAIAKRTRYQQGGLCILAVGGHAWPEQMRIPPDPNLLVGYRVEYSEGLCWNRWTFDTTGLAYFDLDRFSGLSPLRLRRAELHFRRGSNPAPSTCRSNYVHRVGAVTAGWRDRGRDFVVSVPTPVTSARSGRGGVFDVTDIVRAWLNGEWPNEGFALFGGDGSRSRLTMNCAGYYRGLRLTMELE